jgi:hypothetical protein
MSHNLQFQANYTWSHSLDYGATNTTFTASSGMSMLDPHNIRADYGNTLQNVPNRFVFTAVATSPWHAHGWKSNLLNDYEFSPSFAAQNGDPYSANMSGTSSSGLVSAFSPTGYVTGTVAGNGSYNGSDGAYRIPGFERDAFKLPASYMFDARISKHFTLHDGYQLELLAEGFNLLNHQNVTAVNENAYTLGTAKTSSGQAYNTLTEYTTTTFGQQTFSNNNNIYTPREMQLGARFQF